MGTTPEQDQQADVDAEAAAWANVDASDPIQVARALAAVGARAGAKLAVLEHMHDRIGRALAKLDEATTLLNDLVPRAEMERQLAQLRQDVDDDRAKDRRTSWRRFVGLIVTGLLFAAVVISAIWLNRLDIERDQQEDERFARRSEVVAICASTYPGNEPKIRECVEGRLGG